MLHIALMFVPVLLFGQEQVKEKWEKEKDYLEYRKGDKYKGPSDWYGSDPAGIREDQNYPNNTTTYSRPPVQYNPQQIKKDRQKRYQGFDRGGGQGTLKHDPKVERPDPWEVDPYDAPDVDLPDVDAPSISENVWKILLFILIFAVIITVLYLYLKNRQPSTKKVIVDVEDDWNPEVITKSELELRLEKAMDDEDYRECVRIYFTFILQELIKKGWIKWEKDKTNFDYSLEMRKKPESFRFDETVRLYDIIWYGEYEIGKDIYELVQPVFDSYYKNLQTTNEK